jgi:hypothetical protein
MSEKICGHCGDSLSYIGAPFNRWIHLRLPIARAWTHEALPVEPGSADSSGAAAADPTPREDEPPIDAIGRTA